MLTYIPKEHYPVTEHRREYPWALLLMVFAWLWPGVFSHDLWKPSEPSVYTVIETFTHQPQWQLTLFGQAYFDVAPIYVWVASIMQHLLTPWAMDHYAAARMASVLFTVLGLLGCGMAAYRLLGKHQGRSAVLILIGSVGLLPISHFINGFSVIFAAVGLIWWGFAIAQKQVVFASLLNGLGLLLLAQSSGLLLPIWILLFGMILAKCSLWQEERLKTFLGGSIAIAVPLISIYPLALLISQPEIGKIYWQYHLWGAFGGLAHFQTAFSLPYYLEHILWFALPALPLSIWTIIHTRLLSYRYGVIACLWLLMMGLYLAWLPEKDQDWLVLLLPALAILGAAQLDSLRRGAAAFLNWFGGMLFGLAALFLWIGFVAMNFGFPAKLAERAAYFSPYYTRDLDFLPIFFAVIFTVVWLKAINRRRIRGRQAVTNWAAGVTLVWALLLTLFLPWIDAAKSYRPVVQQMQASLSPELKKALIQKDICLSIDAKDKTARIAWQQYGSLPFIVGQGCHLQLVEYNPSIEKLPEQATVLWHSARPRNKHERFALLKWS